jgi:histone H3/H4
MTGIIVRTKIKEIVKRLDTEGVVNNISEEVGGALDEKIEQVLEAAIKRAKANQRKTLFARDI